MKPIHVALALMLLSCKPGGEAGASAVASASPAAPAEKPLVAKADELVKAYKTNEVAADDKYKGKRIRVVGIMEEIGKDALGNMQIRLMAKESLIGVMATMRDSEKPKVVVLEKDKGVVLECVGRGMLIGTPLLDDCTVLIDPNSKPASSAAAK